ncbi:MAG: hypothetical protein IKS16_03720 [Lachnospiraceae bacterium]|nr:hypothetical protein [Lachnospiraceae bacterium]
MCGINRISFEELKKAPVSIKMLYVVMAFLAVTGLVLIMIDIFAVGRDNLTIALACIVTAQIINIFGVCRYAGKLHRGEDR